MIFPDEVLYQSLKAVSSSNQGGLINNPNQKGMDEQVAFVYDKVKAVNPKIFLEIGTNKCYFDCFLLMNFSDIVLYTCDIADFSEAAVRIVSPIFGERLRFEHCSSQNFFAILRGKVKPEMAWIDGDHSYEGCLNDLRQAAAMEIPTLMVDDCVLLEEVRQAVSQFCSETSYTVTDKTSSVDDRGISLLEKR